MIERTILQLDLAHLQERGQNQVVLQIRHQVLREKHPVLVPLHITDHVTDPWRREVPMGIPDQDQDPEATNGTGQDPTAEVLDVPDPDQEAGTGDTAVLGQGVHTDLADHAMDIPAAEAVRMIGTIGIQNVIGLTATDDHTVDLPCLAGSGTRATGRTRKKAAVLEYLV